MPWFSNASSCIDVSGEPGERPRHHHNNNDGSSSRRSLHPDPPGQTTGSSRGGSSTSTGMSNSATDYQTMRDQYDDLLHSNSNLSEEKARRTKKKAPRQKRAASPTIKDTKPPSPPSQYNLSVDEGPKTHNYRGFSTSIGDMFVHPHQERVDCCAMTCCGIFQSDRDRFLLQGVTPPSPWKRVWVHFCLPLIFFLMAGYAALHIPDKVMNEFLVLGFLLLLLAGIFQQCQKGRIKRMDIRKDVLWYKYQLLKHQNEMPLDQILDQPRPHDGGGTYYYRGQTERDVGCSHPYCFLVGCYPNDKPSLLANTPDDNPIEESLCSCIFKFFCRPCCGMFLQLGGVCGMAQESREIEMALLPSAYRRLDYITMQPMMSYFESIYNRRWRQFNTLNTSGPDGPKATGPMQFLKEQLDDLSLLSKTILKGWVALTLFLGIWSVLGPIFWTQFLKGEGRRHYFSVGDYIVYLISWVVIFGTLAFVIYLCERCKPLELSLDAMIKYFACGFVLSTTLSIFYELAVGITLRLIMLVLMTFSGVTVEEDQGYRSVVELASQPLLSMGFGGGGRHHHLSITAAADGGSYLTVFGRDHPILYSIYLFINCFFMAAFVEELCKYFGYRMMEHPDFLSRNDLEDAAQAGVVGGEEGGDTPEQKAPRRVTFENHGLTLEAQGAAVTVAMICVALGVSCCEDLIYVFFYNGSSVSMELYVLIARTFFPIHPIAAALQSIGVCERDVEKNPTRIGKILLPAIIFHGTYDFLLVWIDFLASLKRSDGYNNVNSDEALEIGRGGVIASYGTSIAIMGAALYWFYKESKAQRERLAARDLDPSEFSPM